MSRTLGLIGLIVLAGCGQPPTSRTDQSTPDAATPDASTPDASTPDPDQAFCDLQSPTFADLDTSDATFTVADQVACLSGPCLCGLTTQARETIDSLARCEAMAGGFYWDQGSVTLRTRGRASGKCLLDVFTETEGGVFGYSCQLPLPVQPWPGLLTGGDTTNGDPSFISGIESDCQQTANCSVFPQSAAPCASSVLVCTGEDDATTACP